MQTLFDSIGYLSEPLPEGLKDHIHKEWTGQNETEDELFRIIKAMFLRFQEKKGCIDLTELRDDVLNEIHDHLIQGR